MEAMAYSEDDAGMMDAKKKGLMDLIKQMQSLVMEGYGEQPVEPEEMQEAMEGAPDMEMPEQMPEEEMPDEGMVEEPEEEMPEESYEDGFDPSEMKEFMQGRPRKESVSLTVMQASKGKGKPKGKKKGKSKGKGRY